MPVGFKNGTRGTVQIAIDAVRTARHPHHFLSITKQGLTAIVATKGNLDCHIILRGGSNSPNYDAKSINATMSILTQVGLQPKVMVDCSHANSGKDHNKQPKVANALASQIADGSTQIFGIMLESFLLEGRQEHEFGVELTYGQSITDACMSWEQTTSVLQELACAVQARRTIQQ